MGRGHPNDIEPPAEEATFALLEDGAADATKPGMIESSMPALARTAIGARAFSAHRLPPDEIDDSKLEAGSRHLNAFLRCSVVFVLGAALLNVLLLFGMRCWSRYLEQAPHIRLGQRGVRAPTERTLWEAAQAKASKVEADLTDEERFSLLRGMGALTSSGGPTDGYYVGNTEPIERLGIPALKMQDASSGFRPTGSNESGTTTCWPSLLALASSWDPGLVGEVAAAIAREFRGKGANVLLGPGVNVHRTTRGGRNFEYLSGEDPFLGAKLAPAYVRAVQKEGVMVVVKHFAFNEQELDRMTESSNVDESTAWELYYPPFEAAIKAGAGAVMCAYNKVNGTPACQHTGLLLRDLKEKMGFAGFVMSDWWATHSTRSLERGLDMEMPTGRFLKDARLANVSHAAVRAATRRVLAAIFRLGLDDRPAGCVPPACRAERRSDQRSPAHRALARAAAARSAVLLRNAGGVLPLRAGAGLRRLAVLGLAADAKDTTVKWGEGSPYSGGGSGHVAAPSVVTPLAGIRQRASREGINVTASTNGNIAEAQQTAHDADIVIVVSAATSSESRDRMSLILSEGANELITSVASIRPTIVLMETPGAVVTPWRNKVAAVACLFLGGEETGNAWAEVLFGDVEPTGRLPIGLPETEFDTIEPGIGGQVNYAEGLLTSYRSPSIKFAFPFGHGLSYTKFEYGKPRVTSNDCVAKACVSIAVTNVGDRDGTDVVQAYIHFPVEAGEPKLVLRGFHRTKALLPAETQEVQFTFTERDLSVYRSGLGWVLQHNLQVNIGASSRDIRRVVRILPQRSGDFKE